MRFAAVIDQPIACIEANLVGDAGDPGVWRAAYLTSAIHKELSGIALGPREPVYFAARSNFFQ